MTGREPATSGATRRCVSFPDRLTVEGRLLRVVTGPAGVRQLRLSERLPKCARSARRDGCSMSADLSTVYSRCRENAVTNEQQHPVRRTG
jgi:hypothetical protein